MAFVGYWAQADDYSNKQTQIYLARYRHKEVSRN